MQANLRAACPKDIRFLFTGIQLLFKNKIRPRSLATFTHTSTEQAKTNTCYGKRKENMA